MISILNEIPEQSDNSSSDSIEEVVQIKCVQVVIEFVRIGEIGLCLKFLNCVTSW